MDEPLQATDTIAELLAKRPGAGRVLLNHRMHCVGCEIAPFETLAEACAAYGVAVGPLLEELDAARHVSDEEDL